MAQGAADSRPAWNVNERCARSHQSVVFGHEFCGEVLDHGPGTRKTPRSGTPVVAVPFLPLLL
jgi:threonine dehydrogenase-like Zn-dependent dehydrogenase